MITERSMKRVLRIWIGCLASASICGCNGSKKDTVSYYLINHTDMWVSALSVNGEGGILNAEPMGGGGKEMCCVVLPHVWRPGLMVTIKWEEDGGWAKDASGTFIMQDGYYKARRDLPTVYKTKTVEVPEYKGQDADGQFFINIFPNDVVKVLRFSGGPGRPAYPYPDPEPITQSKKP